MVQSVHRNSLPPGHEVHWYRIERVLGQGAFGITYLAHDANLDQRVAIKEYLPMDVAVREDDSSVHPVSDAHGEQYGWGLDRFISEAQTLARACGKSHLHNLEPEDLVALTVEAAAMAQVPLAGTNWIPGLEAK